MPTPIEIFKPGRHIDTHGTVVSFSDADLEACAAAYDPALHEAPIVIGHPQQDDPAYGWVKTLAFAEGSMQAGADQLDPAFAEAVGAGRYKKVSASFYTPTSPANPKPGVYYLRHVGFLGASPPAVKGLRQVAFAEGDAVTLEFGDWNDRTIAGLFRSMREWVIGKFGQDEADKALPAWDVNTVQETAAQLEPAGPASTGFSEGTESAETIGTSPAVESPECPTQPPAELTPAPAPSQQDTPPLPSEKSPSELALEAREAELRRREAALAERERKSKLDEHTAFLEGLVKDGRPLPCSSATILNFMRLLDGEVLSFGEGETRSPLELFKEDFLAHLPQSVNFAEVGGGADAEVDEDPETIATRAVAYQEEQRTKGLYVTTSEAVAHVKVR